VEKIVNDFAKLQKNSLTKKLTCVRLSIERVCPHNQVLSRFSFLASRKPSTGTFGGTLHIISVEEETAEVLLRLVSKTKILASSIRRL